MQNPNRKYLYGDVIVDLELDPNLFLSQLPIVIAAFLSTTLVITPAYCQEDAPPITNAGSSEMVSSGENVPLDRSNSCDPDGDNLNYYWYQIGGQNVSLYDSISTANPTFVAPNGTNPTIQSFEFIVDDNKISSSPSYVQVRVNPPQVQSLSSPASSGTWSPQSSQLTPAEIVFILIIIGAMAWTVTHRRKYRKRRYFTETVKKQHCMIKTTNVLSARGRPVEYGIISH